jgi:methionine biosynthesis protein MetW
MLLSKQFKRWYSDLKRISEIYGPAKLDDFGSYDEYWSRRGQLNIIHSRWKIALELIPDGASILDVGCGSGEFLSFVRASRPDCVLNGIDISEQAIDIARGLGISANIVNVENEDIQGTYDFVTCLEVLEHIAHAEIVLHRLVAVSRKYLIISIPNVGFIGARIRLAVFGRFPITLCVFHMREHVRFWTVKDFREWIAICGYQIVEQHPQHGVWILWRWLPSLFASAMVYVIESPAFNNS